MHCNYYALDIQCIGDLMLNEPVVGDEFFDRTDLMKNLGLRSEQMLSGNRRNIGLIGLRKVGKTSIIWEFMRQNSHFVHNYIYIKEKPTKTMFRKILGSVLYACMEHFDVGTDQIWMTTDKNLKELAMRWVQVDPMIAKLSFEIRDAINEDAESEELLDLILGLIKKLSEYKETSNQKPLVLIFDEFQNFALWGDNILETLRENLMMQKNVWWIVAGSSISMMENIINASSSPLYGHFETIYVGPFEYSDARTYLTSTLDGILISETHLSYIIDITGGYPYYLASIGLKLCDIAQDWNVHDISKNALLEAIAQDVFYRSGNIYKHCHQLIVNSLEKKGLDTYLTILSAIALENHRFSEIARYVEKPGSSLTYPLERLIASDLIVKNDKRYDLADPILALWLKHVYILREESYIPELELKLDVFKSQISQMIDDFKDELGHARESQIREIFTKKGYTVASGNIGKDEFDLIIDGDEGLILGEVKAGNVDTDQVYKLLDKVKRIKKVRAVGKVILFALFGSSEQAKRSCIENEIEIWDIEKVNNERKRSGLVRLKM